MKKNGVGLILLGAGMVLSAAIGLAQPASKPGGRWQGKIQIPDHELGITVDLDRNSKGVWIGSMSVTGSTSVDVPLNNLSIEGTAVRFAANLPERASFEGHLSADGSSLSGTASNANGEAPFQLTRSGEAKVQVPPPSSALPKELEGAWEGTIAVGGKVRRVGLKLSPAADGTAMATLIAVDHGNFEIPVATVTIQDRQVQLNAPAISGSYRGTRSGSGDIAGEWTEGPDRLPLTFKHLAPDTKKP
ncbi:MAG TPA: hypothetical protein VGZ73_00220 [Bryobacteraceae bacterium]|jgi:hypothetical protein|nr:hypothetical protein [Bryobacteraceae bacterium]